VAGVSLSKGWDETRAILARDGRLIWPLGLAFLALPGLIVGQFLPAKPDAAVEGQGWVSLLLLASLLIGLAGQLAIQWLALTPDERVGDAIRRGLRAMPRVFLTLLLVSLPSALLILPLLGPLTSKGPNAPAAGLAIMVILLVSLLVLVRLMLSSPVAVAEQPGIVTIIKRSWVLTRGSTLKFYGFILLFLALLAVVSWASMAVLGSLVILAAGQPTPWSTSAILVGLIGQLAQLAVAVPFTIMLARLYAQLARGGGISVPHAP
jgi:hypothetical protein